MIKSAAYLLATLAALAAATAGCESHIRPLGATQRIETWVPDDQTADATQPSTQPAANAVAATTPGDTTQPTTAPAGGHMVVKIVDPNQTSRFIYHATYDNIWQQAITILNSAGFAIDRHDYRLGVLTTAPLPSAQILEFWKPQLVNANDAMENTINTQRRVVRITISKVPEKPDFYEIAIQALVERQNNPAEDIGGPVFVEGSGFGRNSVSLRSDYAPIKPVIGTWVTLGHDPDLEQKLLKALFNRI